MTCARRTNDDSSAARAMESPRCAVVDFCDRNYIIKLRYEKEIEHVVYRIKFQWDDEAAVWIATSKDVPGFVLESGSFDALIERVKIAMPELIKLNGAEPVSYRLEYTVLRKDIVPAYG